VASSKGYTCERANVYPADLIAADGVWLISSITLAARVTTLNGVELPVPAIAQDVRSMVDLAVESIGDSAADA
jgi:4-amino-4-deoxychorismate lyase